MRIVPHGGWHQGTRQGGAPTADALRHLRPDRAGDPEQHGELDQVVAQPAGCQAGHADAEPGSQTSGSRGPGGVFGVAELNSQAYDVTVLVGDALRVTFSASDTLRSTVRWRV